MRGPVARLPTHAKRPAWEAGRFGEERHCYVVVVQLGSGGVC